ncbi:MAG: Uncharacterised protein [Arcobacter lacus]|nr:MAG: Uncharacterised protein [Arcobacter lacus]
MNSATSFKRTFDPELVVTSKFSKLLRLSLFLLSNTTSTIPFSSNILEYELFM